MQELIDRQALIADYRICGGCSSFENCSGHITMCDSARVRQAINEVPTIEAEPVRHGQWIQSDALDYKDPNGVIHVHGMCSCCRLIYDFRDMTSRFNFCPNCGTDMRVVSEDVGTD